MPDPPAHSRGIHLFRSLGRRIAKSVRLRQSSASEDSASDKYYSDDSPDSDSGKSNVLRDKSRECQKNSVKNNQSAKSDTRMKSDEDTQDSSQSTDDDCSESSLGQKLRRIAAVTKMLNNLRIHLQRDGKRKRKKPQQKSILRKPVRHVYVRGISGLPTKRVPVSSHYYRKPRPASRFYM